MQKLKLGELVLDYNFYPRMQIDLLHASYMRESLEAGAAFPPMVICAKSKRIADGFHRHHVYSNAYGLDYVVEVVAKKYRNDGEILLDAIRFNASHGRALSRYDRAHCLLLAEGLKLSIDDTAMALGMTVDKVKELRVDRCGKLTIAGQASEPIALKQTIRHMAGKTLTSQQAETNKHLSGMSQIFYVNQLISLIESDLLDLGNAELLARLRHLQMLIGHLKVAA